MREAIIIGVIVGFLFFAGSATLTALAIKNATDSALWDYILWAGVGGMLVSVASLAIFISSQVYGRPFWMPVILINLAICLGVLGIILHFSDTAPNSLPIKQTALTRQLGNLSNNQLKASAIELAKRMRAFEDNAGLQMRQAQPRYNVKNTKEQNKDDLLKYNKIMDQMRTTMQTQFANEYLGNAREIINEITYRLRQIGIFPPYVDDPQPMDEQNLSLLRDGRVVGWAPISQLADYIERLAGRLK